MKVLKTRFYDRYIDCFPSDIKIPSACYAFSSKWPLRPKYFIYIRLKGELPVYLMLFRNSYLDLMLTGAESCLRR